MDIDHQQIDLIRKSKSYIEKSKQKGLDTSCFANSFFVVADQPSYFILKYFIYGKNSLLHKFYIFLKSLYSITNLSNYKIYNDKKANNFIKIVVTWSKGNDFEKDGSYNDRYFKVNSKKDKQILWFLISLDSKFPRNLNENIIVLFKEDKEKKSFFYLIKTIFINLFRFKFSISKFLASLSFYPHFSEIIFKKIKPLLFRNNFKKIVIPYESQPFQNYLFKNIKKHKQSIETVGYMHSSQPFPIHNLFRDGSPEKLLVHGSDQKFHLINYLGWPDEVIKLIPSMRFKKKDKLEIQNKILLPYHISNSEIYLQEFEKLLLSLDKKIKPLTIVNHPHKMNSNIHLRLEKKLNHLLELHKNIFSADSQQSEILIFGPSYVIIEALERGLEFTHICAEPILESYSETFWPNISVMKTNNYVFKYSLKNFGACVNLSVENNIFHKYCVG
jgi:hypothetical protein|tara:strand:- start:1570 stop:2901 length:1332 start_codon:yes stop_codon:yes gene_type:complete